MSQYLANLCQTTCTGPHTMFGRSVGLPGRGPLGPPPPLGRHPAEHARLGRTDRRGADGVRRLGRVPQVGQHVHAAPLDLGGLRVLVLVDHVLVDRQVHQPVDLPAPPTSGRTSPGSGGSCRRASARRRRRRRRPRAATRRRGTGTSAPPSPGPDWRTRSRPATNGRISRSCSVMGAPSGRSRRIRRSRGPDVTRRTVDPLVIARTG